jgi:hypothetical protein
MSTFFLSQGLVFSGKQPLLHRSEYIVRFHQPARPFEAGGQEAHADRQNLHAVRCQFLEVFLGRWMDVHIGIHGRCDHDRAACRKVDCGERVVAQAVSHFGDGVCSRRHHDHEVGPGTNIHMGRPVFAPQAAKDFAT